MKVTHWLPVLVFAVLAAALGGAAFLSNNLALPEDQSAELTKEIQEWTQQVEGLTGKINRKHVDLEYTEGSLREIEKTYAVLQQNKEYYDDLLQQWAYLSDDMAALKEEFGSGGAFTYTVPPNYDRQCLTYLQSGTKTSSFVAGLFGGVLGNAFGNQVSNMSQEDVGTIHGLITELTYEMNEAIQRAEQSLGTYHSNAVVMDLVFDPQLTGKGLESQISFLKLMYRNADCEEACAAMLQDTAWAVKTLECTIPIYSLFLSECTENRDYLQRLNTNLQTFRQELMNHGVTADSCLEQEKLDELYFRTARWYRELTVAIQNCEVWLDLKTMETSFLGGAYTHKMLVTIRDKKPMLASDPKDGLTAFYGFTSDGEPACFIRGEDYILFDLEALNGTAIASTCAPENVERIYQFALLIRDYRNGFGKTLYEQYQRVY